jgi:hypothetical protein
MAARNRTRAARPIAERTKRNAEAVAAGIEAAEEARIQPRRKCARTKSELERLLNRNSITLSQKRAGDRLTADCARSNTVIGRLVGRYEVKAPRAPAYQSPPDTPLSLVGARGTTAPCGRSVHDCAG